MLNYSRDDILITTARVALFFTLLFSYPVLLHPTRAAINRLLVYMYNLSAASLAGRGRRRGRVNDEYEEVEKKRESEEEEDEPLLPKAANISSDAKVEGREGDYAYLYYYYYVCTCGGLNPTRGSSFFFGK